jgi:oligoendopeptidase F
MWETINKNKASLVKYLKKKKELLKADTLAWHDFGAPVGNQNSQWSYEQGAEFIVEQFNKFSPLMATFAEKAFTNRWIEAENRGDKGAGAFCTSFPIAKESRIFTTFSGTVSNVTTLAHELGHGFHDLR